MTDTNCPNCGAAAEPTVCSYCLTPRFRPLVSPRRAVVLPDTPEGAVQLNVLYGWAPIRSDQMAAMRWV